MFRFNAAEQIHMHTPTPHKYSRVQIKLKSQVFRLYVIHFMFKINVHYLMGLAFRRSA